MFLPEDTDLALRLQTDDDGRCSRGHRLTETTGEDAPYFRAKHFTCQACAAIDLTEHRVQGDVRNASDDAFDIVAGRHYYAVIDEEGQSD